MTLEEKIQKMEIVLHAIIDIYQNSEGGTIRIQITRELFDKMKECLTDP